ncbi:MAG TPA: response regulator transcription factor [Pseudonocardiaceae bacterium]
MRLAEDNAAGGPHSEQMPIRRLLLVDDHLMLTEALSDRLGTIEDIWVAGRCCASDPDLLDVARRLRPDVITIEVLQLGSAADKVLGGLISTCPGARVVVLSAERDASAAVLAARAGAAAWVPKDRGADELVAVLRGVCAGDAWYPPELLGPVLRALRSDVRQAADRTGPLDVLSPRERDVLTGMLDGGRARQIADDLAISVDTVRTHTKSILAKLGVHSRLDAVRVARAAGLRPEAVGGD